MKKKIIFAATAVFMAAAVSVFTYISSERDAMDNLFNANVEALANSEIGGSASMCSQTRKPGHHRMYSCSNCGGKKGDYAMDKVAFCL